MKASFPSTARHPAAEAPGAFSPAAVGLVTGIYIHFLIFAQFGFLQGIRSGGHPTEAIHRLLGAMAMAGIAASIAGALALRRLEARIVAAIGFALAATAGAWAGRDFSRATTSAAALTLIAILTGAGLGGSTVAAAVLLRNFTGGRRIALHGGLGTGLAYLVCNLPAIFTASPAAKGWIAALAALAGLVAAAAGRAGPGASPSSPYTLSGGRPAVAMATLGFLALVWFDSAAFTAVQASAASRDLFWSGPRTLWTIGATHALAAVAAGAWIDRGGLRMAMAAAMALLAAGHHAFASGGGASWAAPVYAAGVSLYSTALAVFAALGPADAGLRPGTRAAWVYALAGWIGSGAGVGLAEQFGRVPWWATPSAALVLVAALLRLPSTR